MPSLLCPFPRFEPSPPAGRRSRDESHSKPNVCSGISKYFIHLAVILLLNLLSTKTRVRILKEERPRDKQSEKLRDNFDMSYVVNGGDKVRIYSKVESRV